MLYKLVFPLLSAIVTVFLSYGFQYAISLFGFRESSILKLLLIYFIIPTVFFVINLSLRKIILVKIKTWFIIAMYIIVAFLCMNYSYYGISRYYDYETNTSSYDGSLLYQILVWFSYVPFIVGAFIDFVLQILKLCKHKKWWSKIIYKFIIIIVSALCIFAYTVVEADFDVDVIAQITIAPYIVFQLIMLIWCIIEKRQKWLWGIELLYFVVFVTCVRLTVFLCLIVPLIGLITIVRLLFGEHQKWLWTLIILCFIIFVTSIVYSISSVMLPFPSDALFGLILFMASLYVIISLMVLMTIVKFSLRYYKSHRK